MEITAPLTTAARNKMALINGLILGLIYIIISTGVNLSVNNMIMYYALKTVSYIVYMILLGLFAKNIRKANGGYIEFREVFGAVFVMLLIAGSMIYLYYYLYMFVIDPEFMDKMKAATLQFMESSPNVSDDKLNETAETFDKQIAESKSLNIGKSLLSFLGIIVLDCLFGLIVCAIVKKPKPLFE
jgi:hypothetical protein